MTEEFKENPGGLLVPDDDWKKEAEKAKEAPPEEEAPPEPEPYVASVALLIGELASKAMIYLGGVEDPLTGNRIASVSMAKFRIDMLQTFYDLSKSNMIQEEFKMAELALSELRGVLADLEREEAERGSSE